MKKAYSMILARLACTLAVLVVLGGCNSHLTSINAPATVAAGETFTVKVTHEILDGGSTGGFSESAVAFGVLMPTAWTVNPESKYTGYWNSTTVEFDVAELPLPADTNVIEFYAATAEPPLTEEELAYLNTADCKGLLDAAPGLPPGYKLVYLQTTPSPLPVLAIQDGDSGELDLSITAGGVGGDFQLVVIHGIYFEGEAEVEDGGLELITGCLWYPEDGIGDPDGDLGFIIPSSVDTNILQVDSETVPVPVVGGPLAALLALMLAGLGFGIGRRQGRF